MEPEENKAYSMGYMHGTAAGLDWCLCVVRDCLESDYIDNTDGYDMCVKLIDQIKEMKDGLIR